MARENVAGALQRASFCLRKAGVEDPRIEAELLLSWVTGRGRLALFLERNRALERETLLLFYEGVRRRARGEPLAYITGRKEFYGLEFTVNRHVLVPRPETELLVEAALAWVSGRGRLRGEGITAVDLGTGSGALAVTLAYHLPAAEVFGVDISPRALQVARQNAVRLGVAGRIRWCRGDYFQALSEIKPQPRFNLVVANPPYISRAEWAALPVTVREYEPQLALDGGDDGLAAYRRFLPDLPPFIVSPGLVLLEVGAGQAPAVEELCRRTTIFHAIDFIYDWQGYPRVVRGLT